jgi:hypothetical protein
VKLGVGRKYKGRKKTLKLKKSDWIVIICGIIIFQVIFCWGIDISVSAMINSPDAILFNGWRITAPAMIYHLCLYGLVIGGALQMIIGVHIVLREEERK